MTLLCVCLLSRYIGDMNDLFDFQHSVEGAIRTGAKEFASACLTERRRRIKRGGRFPGMASHRIIVQDKAS